MERGLQVDGHGVDVGAVSNERPHHVSSVTIVRAREMVERGALIDISVCNISSM